MTLKSLKTILKIFVLSSGLWALGLLSNTITYNACKNQTRKHVVEAVKDIQSGLIHSSSNAHLANSPIDWVDGKNLENTIDDFRPKPWERFTPRYLPTRNDVQLPWSYVVARYLTWPYIVRVYYGYDVTGQAGQVGVDTYFTCFGLRKKFRNDILGLF